MSSSSLAYPTSSAIRFSDGGPTIKRTVMVTGANGYLASYIVKDLLESGHTVHACVRDVSRESSIRHLRAFIPGGNNDQLQFFSTGNLEDATSKTQPFDGPMKSCDAVMHLATPLNVKFGADYDGEKDIYKPAMTSTQELLDCVKRNADTVQCFVLTSSMSAMAPRPEPALKDESQWSDAKEQQSRDNWYGATKTAQEQLVRDWIQQAKSNGVLSPDFVYAAICPTMVIGPILQGLNSSPSGTMGILQKWLQGGKSEVPNDSMSFIHAEDCAKMHTRVLECSADQIHSHQRYMSLIESLHWNDIMKLMKEVHPGLPAYVEYTDDNSNEPLVTPTRFNFEAMHSLGVQVRTTQDAVADSVRYLKGAGGLDE